jgi:photosystem II stability/assembly factor-like uncharacterized protein
MSLKLIRLSTPESTARLYLSSAKRFLLHSVVLAVVACAFHSAASAQSSATKGTSAATDGTWVLVGPFGGDARSMAYDPHHPQRIYLGTSHGEMFVSDDDGGSWSRFARLGDGGDFVLDHIYVDPNDSKLMYVAAWSIENSGGDIFRSRDEGRTWQTLPGMHGMSVRAMSISASNSKIIVAGTLDGVFRSQDGGESWQRISPANHAEIKNIESVAVDPRNPQVIYAGTWHLPWKTDDGGANWHSIKKGVIDDSDVFSIIVDRTNSSVVYMSACSGIYRSEQAGEEFHKIQGIPFEARRTRMLHQDPANPAIVYAGTTEGLWKTSDAGKNWSRITAPNLIVNDVLVDPLHPERVLLATDRSGVIVSNDAGATWAASNRGFAHRQVSGLVVDRKDPRTVYTSVVNDKEFGGVFVSRDAGASWSQINNGLAGRDIFTLQQAANGTLLAGTNRGVYQYSERVWRPINLVLNEKHVPVPAATGGSKPRGAKKPAPATTGWVRSELTARVSQLDLGEHKWFAATSQGVFISLDQGKSWHGGPLLGETNFVAVTALNSDVLAATPTRVLLSHDGGETWSTSEVPSYVTAIYGAAIASSGAIWLATREGALRSSASGSASVAWEHVMNGLPARQVLFVGYDAGRNRLIATCRCGHFFESYDAGNTWKPFPLGYPARSLAISDGRMLAATVFDGVAAEPEKTAEELGSGGN